MADCCNLIELTRQEWEDVAVNNNCRFVNIEVVCSNKAEHKKRAEQRNAEVANMKLPVWDDIENREYHEWHKSRIVINTAGKTIKQCQTELKEKVADSLSQKEDGREYEGIDDSLKATIIEKLCYTKFVYDRINRKLRLHLSPQEIESLFQTLSSIQTRVIS